MIIIDYNGVAVSGVLPQLKHGKAEESFIRHIILNSLRMYNLKYREKYGKMIIACDGRSWRKDVFAQYKAGRKKSRDDSKHDWSEIFRIIGLVKDEIAQHFPYQVLRHESAEADDIVATLVQRTQEFGHHEPVMIISADKDFIQLHKYDNVSQYSPMTKKLVTDKNPAAYLFEHILRGDSGDGVPNVLSADDVFVDESARQTPLRAKQIQEWSEAARAGRLQEAMPQQVYRNYMRNKTAIDLSCIPKHISDDILKIYDSNASTGSNSKILNYLIQKRCNQLVGCVEEFFNK